jgi:hypothetical protein
MASPAPILRFPPFPAPPDGVVIVQFKEFTESGIQIFSSVNDDDGEVEIDGRGIPTVQLRVKHDTDQCKSNTKRKRDKKKIRDAEGDASRPVRRLEWWEQWEQSEHLRVFSYDPYVLFPLSACDIRIGVTVTSSERSVVVYFSIAS